MGIKGATAKFRSNSVSQTLPFEPGQNTVKRSHYALFYVPYHPKKIIRFRLKKLEDQQIEKALKGGNKDILVYLYEKNYKSAKEYVFKHGGSEGDVDAVLKDAIELLWDNFHGSQNERRGNIADLVAFFINEAWQKGEAKRYITRNTRIKHYYLRMYNRKTAGILVLVFIVISVPLGWMYVENYFSEQAHISAVIEPLKSEETQNKVETPAKVRSRKNFDKGVQEEVTDTLDASADTLALEKKSKEEKESADESQLSVAQVKNESDENLVVKKDKLLFAKMLTVIEKSKDNNQNNNGTKELVEKLNPEAHLPEESKAPKNILVEFWQSPVNYKGYKLSHNKIVLFGIEESDLVKLFNIDENMYLEFGSEYFLLENNRDFKPLIKVRDPMVLAQLSK